VISGEEAEIEQRLNTLSRDGWRPIAMSCRLSMLAVIVEKKAMEEAKLSLSSALAEDVLKEGKTEEVQ
jgi:hypothetical protein